MIGELLSVTDSLVFLNGKTGVAEYDTASLKSMSCGYPAGSLTHEELSEVIKLESETYAHIEKFKLANAEEQKKLREYSENINKRRDVLELRLGKKKIIPDTKSASGAKEHKAGLLITLKVPRDFVEEHSLLQSDEKVVEAHRSAVLETAKMLRDENYIVMHLSPHYIGHQADEEYSLQSNCFIVNMVTVNEKTKPLDVEKIHENEKRIIETYRSHFSEEMSQYIQPKKAEPKQSAEENEETKEEPKKVLDISVNPLLEKFFNYIEKRKIERNYKGAITKLGLGYALKDVKREYLRSIDITNSNRKNHIFLFGTTGVGKTRTAEQMVIQDIFAGRNVVFIDPKSDKDMLNTVIANAIKAGRADDLLFLSPIFPEFSIEVNPTSHYYIYEEIVEHVMAAVPSDDDFFYNVAKETTMAIVQSIVLKRKATSKQSIRITLEEIASYAFYDGLKSLKDSIGNINDKSLAHDISKTARLLEQILSSPQDYFSKVSTTLRSALNIMTNGNIGKVLGNASKNDFVERLESGKGTILYVQTGTMLARETANVVGKEVISMIQSVVGRYYLSGKVFKNPLCLYIDELSNVVYKGIQDLYNKGRSAGVWIMGMTQSIADMIAVLGEDGAKQLLDNTNTKIIMRVQDLNSAKIFAELGGVRRVNSPIMNSSGGTTVRETEEYAILPEDMLRLNLQEFYYFGFEGQFYGKTNNIVPANFTIDLPNILQEREVTNG